jgi:hypothetical protein
LLDYPSVATRLRCAFSAHDPTPDDDRTKNEKMRTIREERKERDGGTGPQPVAETELIR